MAPRDQGSSGSNARNNGAALLALVLVPSAIIVGTVMARPSDHRPLVQLRGEQGERPYVFDGANAAGSKIDARSAVFTVANSRNASPTAAMPCETGPLPLNRYPFSVGGAANVTLSGGLFRGRVPQASDWGPTYCNSAAILFRQSPGGVIDSVRISGAWDAVRASAGSSGLTLRGSWISDVRDDLFEDDYLYSATIEDTLVDGAFQGVSVKAGDDAANPDAARATVTISGLLLRLGDYRYKGEMRFGALTKNGPESPRLRVRDSLVAIDTRGGRTFSDYWRRTWAKLDASSGNALLWLSDAPIPATFPLPPQGFAVVRGRDARALWAQARSNWINCHPQVARTASDPRPVPGACRGDRWGGRR
jgi:hypothetical protein